jgi:hypothetical protein
MADMRLLCAVRPDDVTSHTRFAGGTMTVVLHKINVLLHMRRRPAILDALHQPCLNPGYASIICMSATPHVCS